ncbi:manganese efflux pump MntP [Desulforegula conservatrix]|uniref:manganese efflux pump MntP n=1 Tax=Desulforegula conservatrix TaxID=153026 RepID=UPI000487105C|nr:manganese efflux pump MntP family protein [Desulforegula conservatrix]
MGLAELMAIAVALAMDAFSVAIASGASMKSVSLRQTFRLAWHFGLFQALMPVIGWLAGKSIVRYVSEFDHWVAFVLLLFVGLNMIRNSFSGGDDEEAERKDPTKGGTLIILSVATSIDALAVGFSISMAGVDIMMPAAVIGIVALVFTAGGLHLGRKIGQIPKLGAFSEVFGGLALIGIGIRILYEHGIRLPF